MRRGLLFLLVPCACAQLTGVADLEVRPAESEITPPPDGARPEADASDATDGPPATPVDAPFDNFVADVVRDVPLGTCGLPTNDAFTSVPPPPWVFRGNATYANPGVRLTASAAGETGALYWDSPYTFDRLDVTFGYRITTDPASVDFGPGDGLAFAWIAGNAPPDVVLNNGGGFGLTGLTGYAVAIDAYQNGEYMDPAVPNISIKKTADVTNVASTGAIAALIDGNEHLVRVRLANGSVTVSLDGTDVLGPIALPGYAPYSGYFGFAAATGGAFEDHLLTRATVRIGTTGACAAP